MIRRAGHLLQGAHNVRLVEFEHRLPVGERFEQISRDGQRLALVEAERRPLAEMARQGRAHHLLIENIPRNGHAARRQDFPLAAPTQPGDGNIQRAAAKVEDQHVLRMIQRLLVIQRGSHRLEFEIYVLKTSLDGCLAQGFFCLAVFLWIV